jgi:hypothetical protein
VAYTLLTRSYCHLCDEMQRDLLPYVAAMGPLEVVDVDATPELEERFGELVPVLLRDGVEVCHYVLDRSALETSLEEPSGSA